jgi:hypothetical protein
MRLKLLTVDLAVTARLWMAVLRCSYPDVFFPQKLNIDGISLVETVATAALLQQLRHTQKSQFCRRPTQM